MLVQSLVLSNSIELFGVELGKKKLTKITLILSKILRSSKRQDSMAFFSKKKTCIAMEFI